MERGIYEHLGVHQKIYVFCLESLLDLYSCRLKSPVENETLVLVL